MDEIDRLIEASLNGDKLSTARLISMVERADEPAPYIMEKISLHSGNAYYIGVTGPPGAGKSTTVDRLATLFCRNHYSVGVIAVDPTSPFSGGALLGDRIRMNLKDKERDIFFRSMSSGRVAGGLARTTREASKILDASGRQIVIIETVGVGQSELDVAQATDTVLVVLMPESGDTIQLMKAGLMEIANIFAVNKSDRPGADNICESIQGLLERGSRKMKWVPPVLMTTASLNKGIDDLYAGIWRHYEHLRQNSRLEQRRKAQLKNELRCRIEETFSEYLWRDFVRDENMDLLVEEIWQQKTDAQAKARHVVAAWLQKKFPAAQGGS